MQYADAVLSGDAISATSDLEQYSLMAFLDRFIYREAKKSTASRGSSMMQPGLANQDRSNRVVLVKGAHSTAADAAVNSDKFRRKNVHDVAADQLFFHKFFTSKAELDGDKATAATKRKSRRGGRGSDDEGDDDASDAGSIVEAGGDIDGGFDDDDFAAAMAEETGDVDADADEAETDDEMEEEIWKAMRKSMPKAKGDSDIEVGDDDADEDDDDDDVAMYHYSESEEEAEAEEEQPFKSAFDDSDVGEDDDPGFLELDDDVLGSDEDIELGADESDEEEAAGEKKDNKKRKLKHLPTFASADDYAHLLGGSDDEDI